MLEIDGATILLQIVNFLVLLFLLSRFLYKPLQNRVARRAAEVESLLDNVAKREAESLALQEQIKQQFVEAEREAEALILQAMTQARQQSEAILRSAQEQADNRAVRARLEAEREYLKALQANYERTLDTVIDLAGAVLRTVPLRQTHDDLVANLSAYIWQQPPQEINELRCALAEGKDAIPVYTPFPLTESQERIITGTLSSLANRPVECQVRLASSLIAGLQVHIGGHVLDNSLRKQLELSRDQAGQELCQRLKMAGCSDSPVKPAEIRP